jgi:hypothetical protein
LTPDALQKQFDWLGLGRYCATMNRILNLLLSDALLLSGVAAGF